MISLAIFKAALVKYRLGKCQRCTSCLQYFSNEILTQIDPGSEDHPKDNRESGYPSSRSRRGQTYLITVYRSAFPECLDWDASEDSSQECLDAV
jgi:hypothetical protein